MDFERQFDLMYSLDWVFSSVLDMMECIIFHCSAPADACFDNYKHSIKIIRDLGKSRLRISEIDICKSNDDMREWWGNLDREIPNKWRPVLVLQFHFHVVMHFFRICNSRLKPTDKFYDYVNKYDLQRLENIETNFLRYISDIEDREDYSAEIGNSHMWLMDYALEYARLVSVSPCSEAGSAATGETGGSKKRQRLSGGDRKGAGAAAEKEHALPHTDTGLHALLWQLSNV